MDRRSKIIVSVVGIFIVLLALVGITYGYFLTQVQGNTNDTSISITTANLRLVYRDSSPNIEVANIQPGDTVYTKTFTVTNEGNASIDYEVYLEDVINNFVHEEDLLMFVTCTSSKGNICNGFGDGTVTDNTPTFGNSIYPQVNSLLIENSIEPASTGVNAEVHTYTLYLKFKDDGTNQSEDMGKELQGKIQVYSPKDVVAISGIVSGAQDNYYVEIQSVPKTSQISDNGYYIINGVTAGTHTLYVKYIDSNGNEQIVSSKSIKISNGVTTSISNDASTIVVNESTEKVLVNISVSGNTLTLTGKDVVSTTIKSGTLAYDIINNAKNATGNDNRTVYSTKPLTIPVKEPSSVEEEYKEGAPFPVNFVDIGFYSYFDLAPGTTVWSSYEIVDNKFVLNGISSEISDSSIGKYILRDGYLCSLSSVTPNIVDFTTNEVISYTVECNYYKASEGILISTEKILSETDDIYGTSYYFRGGVEDNYLEFNGMCWRIVRIEGDGSIKITLAAQKQCNQMYDVSSNNSLIYVSNGELEYALSTNIKTSLNSWYTSSGLSDKENLLKKDTWCIGGKNTAAENAACDKVWQDASNGNDYTSFRIDYASTKRINNDTTSLVCGNNELEYDSYIGTLITDEIFLSGAGKNSNDSVYYLLDDVLFDSNYMTFSPNFFTCEPNPRNFFGVYFASKTVSVITDYGSGVGDINTRPTITLKSGLVRTGGTGLKTDPYTVE